MEPTPLYITLFGLGTMVALLVLLRVGQRVVEPATSVAKNLAHGNTAARLMQVGQVLATFLVGVSAVKAGALGMDVQHDLATVAGYSVAALALVLVTGNLGLRLLLQAKLPAEIARGNVAAGLAAGAHYVAMGIITSRAVAGQSLRELGLSLAFFAIATVTLHVFITLFRALTTYDDSEQIHGENLAAALSYGGVSIAVAILVGRALEGDFTGWLDSLRGYGTVLAFLFALYPVRQILVQSVLLGAPLTFRGGRLDAGIGAERDAGIGALEAVTYLATALAIAELL